MPNLGISEFTFSFAFLHEHLNSNWQDIRAVPCLPSLRLENTIGYDANIIENGTIFFYQFKTSKYKIRPSLSDDDLADEQYYPPYYKFYLNPSQNYNQHHLLFHLAVDFPDTYYVAPCLNSKYEFSRAFFNYQIMNNSRRVQLGSLEIPEGDRNHFITYRTMVDEPRIWSKKGKPIKMKNYTTIEDFYKSSTSRWRLIDHEYFLMKLPAIQRIGQKYLNTRFKKSFEKKMNNLRNSKKIEPILEELAEIMNSYFNINLVLVGDR